MKSPSRSRFALAFSTLGIALVWCLVLPWLSGRPAIQKRLEFLDQRDIDPSAMYYTELEAMDAILDRIEGRKTVK